jgi:hypothetical protein
MCDYHDITPRTQLKLNLGNVTMHKEFELYYIPDFSNVWIQQPHLNLFTIRS